MMMWLAIRDVDDGYQYVSQLQSSSASNNGISGFGYAVINWSVRLGQRYLSPARRRRRRVASTGAVWGWFTCFPSQVRMCTFPVCQRDYVYKWTDCNGKGSKTSSVVIGIGMRWREWVSLEATTLITGISKFPPWLGNIFGRYKRWMVMKVVLLCIEQSRVPIGFHFLCKSSIF